MRILSARLKTAANQLIGGNNETSGFSKRFLKSVAWNVSGTILSKAFVVLASILVARIMGPDKNGIYGMINSTVVMFSTLAGLGLGITATRFTAEYKQKDKEKCGRIIGMTTLFGVFSGSCMAIILFLSAPWLGSNVLHEPEIILGLKLASLLLIINTISSVQSSILAGFEAFKSIAKISIIQGLISLPIFVGCTLWLSVEGLIIGQILVSCINVLMFAKENRRIRLLEGIHQDLKNAGKEIGILGRFSLPSMLSGMLVSPVMWIGNAVVTANADGYFQLGIFNAAYLWRMGITFIPMAVGSVILPAIIANRGNDRLERVNILLSWIIVNCIAIPLLAMPEFIGWFYGGQYVGNSFNISLLIIIMMCSLLSYKDGVLRNLMSKDKMWWGLLDNMLWGTVYIISIGFLHTYGSVGLAMSFLIALILSTMAFVPFYIRKGIVSKELLYSKQVLLMWATLILQVATTMLTDNVFVRIFTLLCSAFALYNIAKMMLRKER